ncbi:hypothetical protein [Pyrococcus yayanosii]|uniref:Uncharacterized protein n=1 Tax=Pyrococcus yayanosii (strain CH1 / JCM 16557) TaxID=529709 RepID=F8AEK4_PYRYC|nr:hypothetical protein [Pyrococcus yayanosii]AEH24683.1 hypothetical protein PYCH_10000 [Pyrococcus yayanosii CH1]
MNPEGKMMLIAYAIATMAGIISGLLAVYAPLGWVSGWLIYFLSPKIILAVVRDLPEEMRNERIILRKTLWSFFFFWLYFTGMTYTLMIKFQPVVYYNGTLLHNLTKG